MWRNCSRVGWLILVLVCELASAAGKHGIYRTVDRGRSWVRSDQGLDGRYRVNAFAELGGSVFVGTDGGVYVSKDEGRSWVQAGGTRAARVVSMAVVGDKVFAGTDKMGLLVSADRGLSWNRQTGLAGANVRSLFGYAGKLFAGMDADGVMASGDGGKSWVAMKKGLPAGAQIFAMAEVRGKVYAALYAKGLYGWDEVSRAWVKAGEVVPLELAAVGETLIAGHNPGGLHWSADGGAKWRAADGVWRSAPVWKLGSGNGLALAGAADGVFVSEDGGRTWVRARTGLPMAAPGISFHFGGRYALGGFVLP